MQDASEQDPERRALTTNSLSFLQRPEGAHRKGPADPSHVEDSDSAVDSDSDCGEHDFVIFSKPRKPSDCVVHKVAMPVGLTASKGLRNFSLPSPRGWSTPRGPPPAEECQELNAASLNAFAAKADVDEFDTIMTDAGLDEILGENLLGTSTLPMPLSRMTRSHPKSFAVPAGDTEDESGSGPRPHACNGRTSCTECRRGSLDPLGGEASVPKNKYFSRKNPPAVALGVQSPARTIFNSSGVVVGKFTPTVFNSAGVRAETNPSAPVKAGTSAGSKATAKRGSPPRPQPRPKSNTPLATLADSVLRKGKSFATSQASSSEGEVQHTASTCHRVQAGIRRFSHAEPGKSIDSLS